MMRTYFLIPFLLFFVFCIASCCKKRQYCQPGNLKVAFVGFNYSEIRSFVLRRYASDDTTGAKALDSAQFVYAASGQTTPGSKDTIWMSDYKSNGVLSNIYYGNKWTITFSATQKQYVIGNIYDEDHRYDLVKCSGNNEECVNHIRLFSVGASWYNGDVAYITK